MINEEIDRIIARTERRALLRLWFEPPVNYPAALVILCSLTFSFLGLQQFWIAAALFLVVACAVSVAVWIKGRQFQRDRSRRFWGEIKAHGLSGEAPTPATRQLIDRIIAIGAAPGESELLVLRQAVKLVAAHDHQQRQLQGVEARLSQLNGTRETLIEKIEQLQLLGEDHAPGRGNLRAITGQCEALQGVALRIRQGCERLEMILDSVQKAAQTRRLRRELDQISALSPSIQTVEPALQAESPEEIERQIGREIETYLQLERETEEHLR